MLVALVLTPRIRYENCGGDPCKHHPAELDSIFGSVTTTMAHIKTAHDDPRVTWQELSYCVLRFLGHECMVLMLLQPSGY